MIADMSGKPLVWIHNSNNTANTSNSDSNDSVSSSSEASEGVLETLYELHEDWIALETNGYELQQQLDEDAVEVRLQMIEVVKSIRNTPAKASGK
jgi:hypothetical protein